MESKSSVARIAELQRTLESGWSGLYFGPGLEREFRRYTNREYASYRRSAAFISSFVLMLLLLIEHFFLGARVPTLVFYLLLAGVCAPGFLSAGLSHFRWFRVHSLAAFGVMFSNVVIMLAAFAIMTSRGIAADTPYLYESLFFQTSFAYFYTGLLLVPSCVIGFGLWLGFVLTQHFAGLATAPLVEAGFFLLAMNLSGALARRVAETKERRQFLSQQLLQELAEHDPLTGALNRRAFDQDLRQIWRQAQREGVTIGVVALDIDHFKPLNDQHGHAQGDRVLKAMAAALRSHFQRPLDRVARFGGDEFVCLWFDVAPAELGQLAKNLQHDVSAKIAVHAAGLPLSVSVGVAHGCPHSEGDLDGVLARADKALYAAKKAGRNRAELLAISVPRRTSAIEPTTDAGADPSPC